MSTGAVFVKSGNAIFATFLGGNTVSELSVSDLFRDLAVFPLLVETAPCLPLTETEGAVRLYESYDLPKDIQQLPVEFIDTPATWNGEYWRRANTRDTLKAWLNQSPENGKTLVVSDQPNSLYQLEVVRQELPTTFSIEMTADKASDEIPVALYLDTMALWLHNLNK